MQKAKAKLVTILFMTMFVAILIFVSTMRQGALNVISYCFAVLGVMSFSRTLYIWLCR